MPPLDYGAWCSARGSRRGYTWGLAGESFHDDWAFRAGRFLPPHQPNQQQLSYSPKNFYGDHLEIERKHRILGQAGTLRVLMFRNVAYMARWDDAIDAFRHHHPGTTAHPGEDLHAPESGRSIRMSVSDL